MAGKDATMPRVSGTSGLALFDYHFGQTGVHGSESDQYDGNLGQTYIEELIRPKLCKTKQSTHENDL